jgi:hypothetical protein
MKLVRITKPPRSVQVRVTLAREPNAALENYARFYERTFTAIPWRQERSSPRCFAPSSKPTASSTRGHVPVPTVVLSVASLCLRRMPHRRHNRDYPVSQHP